MKHLILFCILAGCPAIVAAQDTINPYNIQQRMTIELHHTDAYYKPFYPPDPAELRDSLSNEVQVLTNPDGTGGGYWPLVRGIGEAHDTLLQNWQPWGIPLGSFARWQRLFQARDYPDGTHSDIIAGGDSTDTVTIGKNEDVDFRATGTIKLENGFHAMPGSFFHAYQEPKWDTAVFSDEFDDTAKFHNQWTTATGWGGYDGGEGATNPSASNVRLVTDSDAVDGHALDIFLYEDTVDTLSEYVLGTAYLDSCSNVVPPRPDSIKHIFASGKIRSCPFPFAQKVDTPLRPAWAHAPYGKYEFRDKIPHFLHHTNQWGGNVSGNYKFEYDLFESAIGGDMDTIEPDIKHKLRHGPDTGTFGRLHDTIIFVSSSADWCPANNPESVIIDNVPYGVQFVPGRGHDTVYAMPQNPAPDSNNRYAQSEWPASLANSTGPISFYYTAANGGAPNGAVADILPWTVSTDGGGHWTIFSAGYHDSAGTTLQFSKWNQPVSVTLTVDTIMGTKKTFNCHWDAALSADSGKGILLLDDTGMNTWDLHSGTEAYSFVWRDMYSSYAYPSPPLPFNGNDTVGGYAYHTFAMEWLPHELRLLVDSVVVWRYPDRLVPPGNPYFDWIGTLPRVLANMLPAQLGIDNGSTGSDPFGINDSLGSGFYGYKSITYYQRHYYEHHLSNPGFWNVTVDGKTYPAAHHLLDYVKVWDVPKDVIIPDYPK